MKVIGARGSITDVGAMVDKLRDYERANDCTVQVFRADRIFGELHVRSAVERAKRAFEQGRNRSDHLGTEVLLYCAAERQIKNAIEMLGVTPDTVDMVVLIIGDCPESEVTELLNLQEADVLGGTKDTGAFGLTDEEIDLVGKNRIIDLIIEKMALSELER